MTHVTPTPYAQQVITTNDNRELCRWSRVRVTGSAPVSDGEHGSEGYEETESL